MFGLFSWLICDTSWINLFKDVGQIVFFPMSSNIYNKPFRTAFYIELLEVCNDLKCLQIQIIQ